MEIKHTKAIIKKYPVIYLLKDVSQINKISLTNDESQYLKKQVKIEKKIVVLNRYTNLILIYIPENIKKEIFIKKENVRKDASKINKIVNEHRISDISVCSFIDHDEINYAFIEGFMLSNYSFSKYFTKAFKHDFPVLKTVNIVGNTLSGKQTDELSVIIDGVFIARNLINEPLSHLNAQQLAQEILRISEESGFFAEVFSKKKIESLKMGGLLSVNKGSINPPTFTVMEWKPANAVNKKAIVFVGKGVVFDTGGINLKPDKSMETMKSDMSGAAVVIALMYIVSKLKIPVYIVGLVPATDNRPGEDAYVPEDIITMHNGKTVEVLNTDAEGRMILADALSYAQKYKPELVIDIATLTGSAKSAVGHFAIVGMGNVKREIFSKLVCSGQNVYERVVEFPFWEEFEELIKSDIADLKNTGGPFAGAITAGKFLEQFTDYPFIHLDIAGPAYLTVKDSYRGKGGTGIPVRLLFDFIKNFYK
ncbi:MAG: leucyl aminopeptidase family protein [Bacteroidota bacterium]